MSFFSLGSGFSGDTGCTAAIVSGRRVSGRGEMGTVTLNMNVLLGLVECRCRSTVAGRSC